MSSGSIGMQRKTICSLLAKRTGIIYITARWEDIQRAKGINDMQLYTKGSINVEAPSPSRPGTHSPRRTNKTDQTIRVLVVETSPCHTCHTPYAIRSAMHTEYGRSSSHLDVVPIRLVYRYQRS